MSVRMLYHKYCGIAANNGYALFYSPNTSTAKTTYTSDYTTPDSLNAAGGVPITSDGWLSTYLLGDYDVSVFTRTGVAIPSASALGINPQDASTSDDEARTINLLANGSFEVDSSADNIPDSWTLTNYSGGTNTRDTADKAHGAASMKFVSVGSGGGFIVSDDFIECSPERAVEISFMLKSTADVRNLVEVIWYTAGGTEISDTDIYDNSATNPTSWATRGAVVVPPATAYYMKIRIYGCHSSDATAGTARFDGVTVRLLDTEIVSIASATTVDLTKVTGTRKASVTGTTTITGLTINEGQTVEVAFTGSLTLTNGASLILLAGQNIITVAGDTAIFRGEDSGVVRCVNYSSAPTVTEHSSYERTYFKTNGTAAAAFDVGTNITEGTFESIGPTGSSATNTYSAMDAIPAGATFVIFLMNYAALLGAADTPNVFNFYGRPTGSTIATGDGTRMYGNTREESDVEDNEDTRDEILIHVALDSALRADLTWTLTGEGALAINVVYRGFCK